MKILDMVLVAVAFLMIPAGEFVVFLIKTIREGILEGDIDRQEEVRVVELCSAACLMKVLPGLLEASIGITIGLSIWKPFADFFQEMLPQHLIGLSIFVAACFWNQAMRIVAIDLRSIMRNGIKRLLQ
jgi:hypothetical protein